MVLAGGVEILNVFCVLVDAELIVFDFLLESKSVVGVGTGGSNPGHSNTPTLNIFSS